MTTSTTSKSWPKRSRLCSPPYPGLPLGRFTHVPLVWPHDLEALETVSQTEEARGLFLRMAHLTGDGQLTRFLLELSQCDEIDPETKAVFAEVAADGRFLSALDEYVYLTRLVH